MNEDWCNDLDAQIAEEVQREMEAKYPEYLNATTSGLIGWAVQIAGTRYRKAFREQRNRERV